MLAPAARRRVDAMWDRIWSSGVSNPLTVVEYLSTVLLLWRLDVDERGAEPAGSGSLWAELARRVDAGDARAVASLLSRVQSRYGIGASPELAAASTWRDLATLRGVLTEVERLEPRGRGHDLLGDVFEHVLSHLRTAGHLGQFRTPRHVVRFVVEAVDPRRGEVVVDPACGTAGFLVAAHEHRGGVDERYLGDEVDATVARLARTNTLLHGMAGACVTGADGLRHRGRDADVLLANPPFAGAVAADRLAGFSSGTRRTELLFLELMLRRLRAGGRAGVVVPAGVLTSPASAAVHLRRRLLTSNRLTAVVELPRGVFRPYTDAKTAVLFWTNEPPDGSVLLTRVGNDGHSRADRREPLADDDLPAALALLRGEGGGSLPHVLVGAERIARSAYDLGPGRYLASNGGAAPASPLPSGWTRAPLSELVTPVGKQVASTTIEPGWLYVGLEHIASGTGECRGVRAEAASIRSAKLRFEAGDLLYGKLRPSLRKCVVAAEPGVCSTDLVPLRPTEPASGFYLAHQLRSEAFAAQISAHVGGTTLPRVRVSDLLAATVPVPPPCDRSRLYASAKRLYDLRRAVRQVEASLDALDRAFDADALGWPG